MVTAEQAAALAEEVEYPTAWKWADGPNPLVGEYTGDAEATTKYNTTKRIRILRDVNGKRWAVWLLGQLDVQWDEIDPAIQMGDVVAVWVRSETVVSTNGKEYRPSRIRVMPKDGSPANGSDAARSGAGHAAIDAARVGAGEPADPRHRIKAALVTLGQWPPSESCTNWIRESGYDVALAALEARVAAGA